MKRVALFFVVMLAMFGSLTVTAIADDEQPVSPMDRAESLYDLSLATEIDSAALREAHRSYEIAQQSPLSSEQDLRAAAAGAEQTDGRLENSDEMFRNVWRGVWALFGDHSAYEWYDSAVELALDRAWSAVVDRLEMRFPRKSAVFPRCVGDEENCGILRDMVLLSAQDAPHLRPVTDDEMARYQAKSRWGTAGTRFVPSELLKRTFPEEHLIVADIQVYDTIHYKNPVERVSVQVRTLNLLSEEQAVAAYVSNVGVDVISRWWHSWLYAISALLAAIASAIGLGLFPSQSRASVMATTLFVGGGVMSAAVVESLGAIQPAMDDLAWDPNGLPLISTWLWPMALGVGLFGGFLIVLLVARSVVLPRLRAWVEVGSVRWSVAALPVAFGASLWLTFRLPTMLGSQGLMIAASIMGVMCGAAWVMGHGFEQLEEGRGVAGLVIPVLVGALAVVVLLLTNSPLWVLLSGLLLIPSIVSGGGPVASTEDSEVPMVAAVLADPTGSLALPTLSVIQMGTAFESARSLASQADHGALVLRGEEGSGKTRWLHAVTDQWPKNESMPTFLAEARPSSASASESEPYDVLAQLLRGALPVLRRLEAIERASETDASFAETGDALLEGLPGVGLILGLLPEAEAASGSERLKADALAAVQGILAERDLVWSIDDVQAVDVESWEAIEHIVDSISGEDEHGGRMRLLLSCSTDDCSRIDRLSRWLETTQIPIPVLDDPALTDLIHCAGLQSPNPEQAAWLRGFGETSGSVLSVVRHLEVTQQLVGQDPQALPTMAALEHLQEPVPTDLLDRELSRLSVIGEEHLLILEMAAQCGVQFEASDVASGLGSTRMQVLSALRKVEVEHGLIEDRNEDDWFSFLMRMTHQALLYRTRTRRPQAGGQHGIPELARAFHSRVADSLIERWQSFPNSVSGERIYRHIASAGPARSSELSQWALVAGEQAADLARAVKLQMAKGDKAGLVHSWERATNWVKRARELRGSLSEEQNDRLDYLDAGCRVNSGMQHARDEARDMFRGLIESTHVDARMALLQWLEVSYEEPEKDALERLRAELEAVSGRTWPEVAMHESVVFYETLVAHRLETFKGGPSAVVEKLEALGDAVDALRADGTEPNNRFVDLLLARIMNELALKLFLLKGDDVPADRKDRFYAAAQRSLGLKQLHGDLLGQAATQGLMGDYLHFVEGDLQGARGHYDIDFEILENQGDINKMPGLLNKIGMVIYKSSTEPSRVQPALGYAQRSMAMATELDREIDMLFAAQQLITLSVSHGLPTETWDQALRDMKSKNVHAAITSEYLKITFAENLQRLRDSIEGDPPPSLAQMQAVFQQEKIETS